MIRTCVYQAFDQTNTLLYVGLSRHWPNRWTTHAERKPWWTAVARLQIDWLPSLTHARWLEAFWIRTKSPIYNQIIPRVPTPPDDLTVKCTQCPTWYHVSLKAPEDRCDDLSMKTWPTHFTTQQILALSCPGICVLDIPKESGG